MASTSTVRLHRITGRLLGVVLVGAATGALTACGPAALTQQVEARRLAADLHLQFTKAAEAANRAVMATTDADSARAAREAEQASEAAARDSEQLRPVLQSLGYASEQQVLVAFDTLFAEFRQLDQELLPLAAEGSNLKAQRLSFGPAREAADRFRESLQAAVRAAGTTNACCAEALGLRAANAVYEIQVLQAPHIAEAEDAAMTRMEGRMAAAESAAQMALDELKRTLGNAAAAQLKAATDAFEQFKTVNGELVTLSRRNSNVRSLALSLGRKRMVAATADDRLRALEEALMKHEIRATR